MLSPVEMPGTLTRNNWKQKHSKPLKWLSFRNGAEVMMHKEAENYCADVAHSAQSHRRAALDVGVCREKDTLGSGFKNT